MSSICYACKFKSPVGLSTLHSYIRECPPHCYAAVCKHKSIACLSRCQSLLGEQFCPDASNSSSSGGRGRHPNNQKQKIFVSGVRESVMIRWNTCKKIIFTQLVETVWVPPIRVRKLWDVDHRELVTTDQVTIFDPCAAEFVIHAVLNVEISCDLDFAKYPFDRQYCVLSVYLSKSSPNTTLGWMSNLRVKSKEGIAVALDSSEKRLQEGNWERKIFQVMPGGKEEAADSSDDTLEILFAFHRYLTSHVIQTFLPSTLLVSASLGSLFVPSGLVPGRMALAVTTTLTLQSMINSVFTEAPR